MFESINSMIRFTQYNKLHNSNLQAISCVLKFSARTLITVPDDNNIIPLPRRKTDLAPVDLVIYALFSHVVRVPAAEKQIFTVQPDLSEPGCCSFLTPSNIPGARTIVSRRSFLCASRRGDRNFAAHSRAHCRQAGFWKLLFRAVREQ